MNTTTTKEKADTEGISEDVLICLRQSGRKMRYFTCDLKREKIIINDDKVTFIPGKETSYDRLLEEGAMFAACERSVEDYVVESILRNKIKDALKQLNEDESRLIDEIFFSNNGDGKSERDVAKRLGIPQKTVNNRKLAILKKLKMLIES